MSCYCKERLNNPEVAELMKDIPEGFCGICDVCAKPGHMRAHPNLPTSGAWCDEHWEELLARPSITIDGILKAIIIAVSFVMIALAIYRII